MLICKNTCTRLSNKKDLPESSRDVTPQQGDEASMLICKNTCTRLSNKKDLPESSRDVTPQQGDEASMLICNKHMYTIKQEDGFTRK